MICRLLLLVFLQSFVALSASLAQPLLRELSDLDCPGPGCPSIQLVNANEVPLGSRVVQLGAFDTFSLAIEEATRISNTYIELNREAGFYFQLASVGDQEFVRLRLGPFTSLDAARRFCQTLVEQGTDCIPVTENDPENSIFRDTFLDYPPTS